MAGQISELQEKFITFARGMPAIAISWQQIKRDVELTAHSLAGVNPGQPSVFMGNIRMPVHGLAYSIFINILELKPVSNTVELHVNMTANIHPYGYCDRVIRTYVIESSSATRMTLDFDEKSNEIYWQEQGSGIPHITPDWGATADISLDDTTISTPKRDNYLNEVERQVIWLTGPSFVRLVASVLPRYKLSDIIPWLRFSVPLRVDLAAPHVVITSSRATMFVGDCTLEMINIESDPHFPYGEHIPAPTITSDNIDIAVYVPRTRLFEFFAKKIEPAVLVSDSGGGSLKWSLAGSIGLKSIVVDLMTAQGLSGVISIKSSVDFVAAARAWIDGPSGIKLSLASASVLGNGDLEADIHLTIDDGAGFIEAELIVTHSRLPAVSWDVNTPLSWPLDEIASEILNHVSKQEIRKLVGRVTKIGQWDMLGLPLKYLDTLTKWERPVAYSEGLEHVSAFVGVRREGTG